MTLRIHAVTVTRTDGLVYLQVGTCARALHPDQAAVIAGALTRPGDSVHPVKLPRTSNHPSVRPVARGMTRVGIGGTYVDLDEDHALALADAIVDAAEAARQHPRRLAPVPGYRPPAGKPVVYLEAAL